MCLQYELIIHLTVSISHFIFYYKPAVRLWTARVLQSNTFFERSSWIYGRMYHVHNTGTFIAKTICLNLKLRIYMKGKREKDEKNRK